MHATAARELSSSWSLAMAPHPIKLRITRRTGRHIALCAALNSASGEPGTSGPGKGTMSQGSSGYPPPSPTKYCWESSNLPCSASWYNEDSLSTSRSVRSPRNPAVRESTREEAPATSWVASGPVGPAKRAQQSAPRQEGSGAE
uniref:Uncharacterized protein n=1 Tax=Zea mays TaxID=4577 RepID=C4JBE4_MAIZE|nr:unknown [Zea mays]